MATAATATALTVETMLAAQYALSEGEQRRKVGDA